MRKRLKWSAGLLGTLLLALAAYTLSLALRQGVPDEFWETWTPAKVRFDAHGIPTIDAPDWGELIQAQGYVVASQRLWQMDLLRRKAGGRLAEWFGAAAFDHDAAMQLEDRQEVVRRAEAALPGSERFYCDLYAHGVNDFIRDHPRRWGLEYLLLRAAPEPWRCADTLLVLLEMDEALTASADGEAQAYAWRRHLSPAWQAFLFTTEHPWNKPYFPGPHAGAPAFPPPSEYLPRQPLDPAKEARARVDADGTLIGSNNWAWRGPTGAFLANDPHLGYSVPGIWFAVRLRVAADDWVVGVTLPGIPGVTLGMNPGLAWAFTNTGEDVDDYLEETLSEGGAKYLAGFGPAGADWRSVERKTFEIKVRGERAPRRVEGAFTHRGPLAKRRFLGAGQYSRQWLPLTPGALRLPILAIARARDLSAFDRAIDGLATPSQNVLVVDAAGDMGYRMSGTGVVRRVTGATPQPALAGEWQGREPPAARRRLYYRGEGTSVRFLASANERLWVDPFGARWASDDRKDRIASVLATRGDFQRTDMEALQLDTTGRFRQLLLRWVADRAASPAGPAAERARAWRAWDGTPRGDPGAFNDSELAEAALSKLLLGRVQAAFLTGDDADVPYKYSLRRAWLTAVLGAGGDAGVAPFGLGAAEVARFVVGRVLAEAPAAAPHAEANRWRGQHPFVGRVPLLGRLFAVAETPQWGASDLVLAEQPETGPSVRMVWDLGRPWDSTWAFPVGESGHLRSLHFQDLHRLWATPQRLAVFDDGADWEFPGHQRR